MGIATNLNIRLGPNFHKPELHILTRLLAQILCLSMRLRLRIELLKVRQRMSKNEKI